MKPVVSTHLLLAGWLALALSTMNGAEPPFIPFPALEPANVITVKSLGDSTAPDRIFELSTEVRYYADVAYLPEDRGEMADFYYPTRMAKGDRLPAVIVIHGGGFNDGDKARPREINFATNLVSGGYVVMSINYKLRKRQGEVTFPQPVLDAKAAVRWLRKNADQLGVDPDHIGVMGGSAGGNLAAMLALTGPEDGFDEPEPYGGFSSRVSCGVDFYGAVKLMEYHDMKMFAKTRAEAPELYEKGSPVNYASPGDAPMLLVHGSGDKTVPLAQSEALAAALQQAGVPHELVVVPGAPHTFDLQPSQRDLRPVVLAFLDRHLKPAMPAAGVLAAGSSTDAFAGVRIERGVEFLMPGRQERADLYLPAASNRAGLYPAVVIIHGGGWSGGRRDANRELNIGTNLALNGYVGMSIDYALATRTQATWPQNLHDCKTAVRWLRKNAGRLEVDPERIGVIGGSAGGHLAAMVTLTTAEDGLDPDAPYGEFSCRVRCGVDLYGIADLPTYHDVTMLGKTYAEDPDLYRRASPITYVRNESPPLLILHGTADTTVDVTQSERFAEALKKVGGEHELVIIPGAPHTFDLQPKQRDLRPLVLGFFDRHLKEPSRTASVRGQDPANREQ